MAHGSAPLQPPIEAHAFIGDRHGAALVSAGGAVDWCCMSRFDAGPVFAALLDEERGGTFEIAPAGSATRSRRYLEDTLVLESTIEEATGTAVVTDLLAIEADLDPARQLVRLARGVSGHTELRVRLAVRFDHGAVRPWIRRHGAGLWSATGGSDALLIGTDVDLQRDGAHDLEARVVLGPDEQAAFVLRWCPPELLERLVVEEPPEASRAGALLDATTAWWRRWAQPLASVADPAVRRSALVLKGLTHAPTGAVVAAPTTSLPERVGGERNWDYRFSWIRDAQFTVRSLTEVGCDAESDAFRRFVERSAAGSADELQIAYGVGGERRLTEVEVQELRGYRGSSPVRIGNAAAGQRQLDVFGYLLELAWRWHQHGRSPDDDFWRFLVSLVDAAAQRWEEPDRGIWEVRGEPQHFVHSKAMCWAALDRGLRLAHELGRPAPTARWARTRDAIHAAVTSDGYDRRRRTFRRAFGSDDVDAALLLLPSFDVVAWDDERMVGTTDVVRRELDEDGLLRRYRGEDGMSGEEGVFVACTFWLAEALARQGRSAEARRAYQRAMGTANDLGLFPEEHDTATGAGLGNFPQGLSHLSHIAAAVAIDACR